MDRISALRNANPPDQEQRDLIREELDTNIMVEAAAGTGKTTSMVERMLALLRSGKCANIRNMAAVTFTRKAAAELRARFQIELEKATRVATGEERDNLELALDHVGQCFIGTIHSFCARLLRERPMEAGVDLTFQEIEEEEDARLRGEAWDVFSARIIADDTHSLLAELHNLGLKLSDLRASFMRFSDFPDVEEWPLPQTRLDPALIERAASELEGYVAHMAELAPRLPEEYGNDTLIPKYRRLLRIVAHYRDLRRPDHLMELLELFDVNVEIRLKEWRKGGVFSDQDARTEKKLWERFNKEVAGPNLRVWRELRYATVMPLLTGAREVYDELRVERGLLSFEDLLITAARLLRENPAVRRYFQARFSHLLVDEFQDTDPIQAEVILLLSSSDPHESDWRRCAPRTGSLFVVGDPKQSIYRFRRADIVAYNLVKKIIDRGGGEGNEGLVLNLWTNFRADQAIIDWVNRVFEPADPDSAGPVAAMLRFPAEESEESPCFVPLVQGREKGVPGELAGIYTLRVPGEFARKEQAIAYEADLIARTIRWALDAEVKVPRTLRQVEDGRREEVDPSDFMIITRNTPNLSAYARKLQEYDIPHRVTGGGALNQVRELRLLHTCLEAVLHPEDALAIVAALRSESFGISDAALYAYARAGGTFSFRSPLPGGLEPEDAEALSDAFDRIRTYAGWFAKMPAVAALERMAAHLGLPALAASRPGGDVEAGSLYKCFELLRGMQARTQTTAQLAHYLERLVEEEESHDGISARSWEKPVVRIMNLHKAKGLEAPIVFLADPSGEREHDPVLHVDRSGDKVLGYMAIYGEGSTYGPGKMLAHPAAWEGLEQRERAFQRAESLRLRYVAATRSAAATIITQKAKRNGYNPWCYFAEYLDDEVTLPDPGPRAAQPGEKTAFSFKEAAAADRATDLRLHELQKPTYDAIGAKQYALSPAANEEGAARAEPMAMYPADFPPGPREEHGVVWGEVIHLLLQEGMENPHADLGKLAAVSLSEKGLDTSLAAAAVQTAGSVMRSEIWHRARRSRRRLVEIPFQVMLDDDVPQPTLVRGVIDLVFSEDGGWILVDYKTDDLRGKDAGLFVERYRPQLLLYERAWEKCTGEAAREAYLYFIQPDLLIKVD